MKVTLSSPVAAALGILLLLFPAAGNSAEPAEPVALSLAEAVKDALATNLGLQLRQEDVAFASGAALATEGAFDPLLTADVGAAEINSTPVSIAAAEQERSATWNAGLQKRFTYGTELDLSWSNNNIDTNSEFSLFDPAYTTGLMLGLSQPLLRGRGSEVQLADLNAARSQLVASSFLVDNEAAELAAQVKIAYWELVYAHQNLKVLQLALALAVQLLDETAAKVQAGKLASIDIYQPESEVARREQDLISGERAIGVAEDNLKLLLNSRNWQAPILPLSEPEIKPLDPDLIVVLERALANRADLKAAGLQIKAAEYQMEKADNNLLPAVNLVGAVGLGGTDTTYGSAIDNSLSDAETQWHVGVTFSRPIDNSFAEGQYMQAVARRNQTRTNLEMLKQEVRRTVRVTVRDIELALKAIEATTKTAVATQKQLEAEQVKFDAGRATTLDVLVAQQAFSSALAAENRAKVNYVQVLAELDRIQGLVTIPE